MADSRKVAMALKQGYAGPGNPGGMPAYDLSNRGPQLRAAPEPDMFSDTVGWAGAKLGKAFEKSRSGTRLARALTGRDSFGTPTGDLVTLPNATGAIPVYEAAQRFGRENKADRPTAGGAADLGLNIAAALIPGAGKGAKVVVDAAKTGLKKGTMKVAEAMVPKVSLTAEQIPYGGSGYSIHEASPEIRQAYTDAAPWTDAQGGDRLSQALGYETAPTQQGHGYWQPPPAADGVMPPAEINPVQVHRPQVQSAALTPEDEAAFSFAQAYRGLNDVQAGTPWHATTPAGAGEADAMAVNMGRQPDTQEMARMSGQAGAAGGQVWNAADGFTLPPQDGFDARAFIDSLSNTMPEAEPIRMAGGDYVDLSGPLTAQNAGSGEATQEVLRRQQQMAPDQQAMVTDPQGAFQALSQDAGAMRGERARQYGVEGVRPDLDLLWKLQAEGGWQRVQQYIEQNGPKGLPVLAGWLAIQGSEGEPAPQP